MITERIKKEILNYIENLVGADAKGLFISYKAVNGDGEPCDDYIYTNVDTESIFDFDGCDYYYGASKFVIRYKNYVIKIPFTGYYCRDYRNGTIYLGGYWEAINPCAEEERIYEEASDEMKEILLPNIFIGNVNSCFPVYIQEAISYSFYDRPYREIEENEKTIAYKILRQIRRKAFRYDYRMNITFLVPLVFKFGIEKIKEIMTDINEIEDLHDNNYGYSADGKPVIFDYAGYDKFSWGGEINE